MHVCIATYSPGAGTRTMLESLALCHQPRALAGIWLVENGTERSAFTPPPAAQEALPLRHLVLSQSGQARARQALVERLGEGLVVFLDDDLLVPPHLLERYAEQGRIHGRGHFFGGPIRAEYQQSPPEWLVPYLPRSVRGWEPSSEAFHRARNPWFVGSNFAAFAEDILEAGGFGLHVGPGALYPGTARNPTGHELFLQDRLRAHGCSPVYLPEAYVTHFVPAEHATPGWALHRTYRNGLSEGVRSTASRATPGPPRWVWRKLLTAWAQKQVAALRRDPGQRFAAENHYRRWRGVFDGARLKAQESP
ncbi:glycosyltransferase family 2 protein [Halorhodospira neutriphila]|uniref:Glycosyltransferase n=1 Tax=Halorhodospira neutriphila TaxID=168379 RepID=A0ABS1E652_9GAMM|nr:glycosyltransferase [Halorhodospira neutriphila]MBK1726998.1 hypothetical protein [Halorhodospira neutriphila]